MTKGAKVCCSRQCYFIFIIFTLPAFCATEQNRSVEIACIRDGAQELEWQKQRYSNKITISDAVESQGNIFFRICQTLDNITVLSEENGNDVINLTESQTSHADTAVFNLTTNNLFWMPFERKIKYGPYESIKWGEEYGKVFDNYNFITSSEGVFEKNCLVFDTQQKSVRPEYCNKMDAKLHFFHKDYTCYLCSTKFINSDYPYVWKKLNVNLSYSFKEDSQILSRSKRSVITNKAIVEMVLSFNKKSKKLLLIIYSPDTLVKKGQEEFIYCFTDASRKLKKRVKVEKIFEYAKKWNDAEKTFFVYKIKLEKYMGYYWCEAYKNHNLVKSNKVIAYRKKEGNEYALRIMIEQVCEIFDCEIEKVAVPYEKFLHRNVSSVFKKLDAEIRVMEIFYYDYDQLDFLLHITTRKKRNVTVEYKKLTEILQGNTNNIKILYFKNSEYCLPETTISGRKSLSWPLTSIGTSLTSEEICLRGNDLPVVRECGGDFLYGGEWLEVNGNCEIDLDSSEKANSLDSLTHNITSSTLQNVTAIIQNKKNLSVLNIYYTTKILGIIYETFGSNVQVVNGALGVVSSLLEAQSDNFKKAQYLLNLNDNILDITEDILTNFEYNSDVYLFQSEYIIVHIVKPFSSNISGIVVCFTDKNDIVVKNFMRNNTFEDIINETSLKLAVYLPESILEDIYAQNSTDIHIVTTVMFDDRFFVNGEKKPTGPVISVTVPGYGNFLPSSLPVLFTSNHSVDNLECGYWKYGKSNVEGKMGLWSPTGGNYLGTFNSGDSIHICTFSHLTHFALLILEGASDLDTELNSTKDYFLTVISLVGSILTIIGIFGIFLTAILFEKWRKRQGTKILINLSVAIFLETIMLYLFEFKGFITTDLDCRIVGTITHYAVLSKFFWMLVYAFLQYMRFVKVLGAFPQRVMLKSAIFGWGFAIIPVVAVNILTPYSYTLKDYHFCYPKGMSLYLGVILPVFVIILINFAVFCIVMHQVSTKKIKSQCTSTSSYTLQLKLATLLFFVLGIPWLFGVLANLISNSFWKSVLVYVFCMTATVQGFVLFLFYVVLNRETRLYWSKSILNTLKLTVVTNSTS